MVGGTLFRAGGTLLLGALTPGRAPTLKFKKGQWVIWRGSSQNLELGAAEAGLPAMFIMDLLLLLVRLEAGSGTPPRDFFGSSPDSKSREPSRRRFEAAGNASLNNIHYIK